MLALIDTGSAGLEQVRALLARHGGETTFSLPLAAVGLLAPLPQPRQMRDGMSYATHIRQSGAGSRRLAALLAGDTIFNHFFARDAQMQEMPGRLGPAKGKSFDGGNVLGPWIVTPDEIPDAQALAVEVRVNGEVFGSGTVGNCTGPEQGRFLHDGDVVELRIERIGVLRDRIAMPQGSAV